jgi:hypothetical protein
MKTLIKYLLPIVIVAFPSARAMAQGSQPPPQISVSGSAEVKVAPDEILLGVGVETRHENLDVAKRENDEHVARSLAFLKASGVKDKDVQTDFISIVPNDENNISQSKVPIYIVRRAIEVKLTKTGSFENILAGLLTNGVNNVRGIEFRTSELRKYRDEARAKAIKAAREKADALAAELGVRRGKVYSVNAYDGGGYYGGGGGYWGRGFAGGMVQGATFNLGESSGEAGTLSVGEISVSASVNVTFLIQ